MAGAKVQVKFATLNGFPSPGTPPNLNRVGILKTGDPKAKNVLVLNPGTSASAAYFEPLARSIVKVLPDWQIWAVERRENFLEDQSELNLYKQGKVSSTDLFNYYLGWIGNPSITNHVTFVPDSAVPFARQWGMNTRSRTCGWSSRRRPGGVAMSPWVVTRWAARSPPRMRPGISTASRAGATSRASS